MFPVTESFFTLQQHMFLVHAAESAVVLCALFGFIKSFTSAQWKLLSVSFFVVMIVALAILLISGLYFLLDNCLLDMDICMTAPALLSFGSWLILLLVSFFINIIAGFTGIVLGTLLFSTTEWLFEKLFSISLRNSFRN